MKKDDIIRKITKDGVPIGPYLMVLRGTKNQAYAKSLQTLENGVYIIQQNYKVYTVAKIGIPDSIYERIDRGSMCKLIHDCCETWNKLLNAQLIMIRNNKYPNKKMLFEIESAKRTRYWDTCTTYGNRNPLCIKVTLGNKIV